MKRTRSVPTDNGLTDLGSELTPCHPHISAHPLIISPLQFLNPISKPNFPTHNFPKINNPCFNPFEPMLPFFLEKETLFFFHPIKKKEHQNTFMALLEEISPPIAFFFPLFSLFLLVNVLDGHWRIKTHADIYFFFSSSRIYVHLQLCI